MAMSVRMDLGRYEGWRILWDPRNGEILVKRETGDPPRTESLPTRTHDTTMALLLARTWIDEQP
jgi:hypothetical protein